jgi:hypothetical protein
MFDIEVIDVVKDGLDFVGGGWSGVLIGGRRACRRWLSDGDVRHSGYDARVLIRREY